MKANGFARLGLGCALALSLNTGHATTLGELWISEVMPDPAALSDAAGEWFELYNPATAPFNLNGTTLGDDDGDLHRIETDLLILPGEYLTLARSAAPGFAPDYVYSSFTLGNSGDEIVLRDPLGDVLRLDYGASFDAPGRTRELLTLPLLAANYGLTPPDFTFGPGDIGTPGFGGSADLSPVPLPASAWLFVSSLIALLSPALMPRINLATSDATGHSASELSSCGSLLSSRGSTRNAGPTGSRREWHFLVDWLRSCIPRSDASVFAGMTSWSSSRGPAMSSPGSTRNVGPAGSRVEANNAIKGFTSENHKPNGKLLPFKRSLPPEFTGKAPTPIPPDQGAST